MPNASIIVQARMGSTRLTQKMALRLNGVSVLEFLLQRLKEVKEASQIVLATTKEPEDDILEEIAKKVKVPVYRGSTNNVLERFYFAAQRYGVDTIVRVCGDNIFLEITEISRLLKIQEKQNFDYLSNALPDNTNLILTGTGLAVEVFTQQALTKALQGKLDKYHKEHVTPYFYENPDLFNIHLSPVPFPLFPEMRLTLDLPVDFENLLEIYKAIGADINIYSINNFLKNNHSMLHKMMKISEQQKKGR